MDAPSPPEGPAAGLFSGVGRSFRHRNYRLFFGGQCLSLIGTWMQNVAQAWLAYRLTGSSLSLGLVSFAGQIPVLVLGLFGGAVADRGNRHRLLVATQAAAMLQACALAVLTLTGTIDIWAVYALAAVLGVVNALDIPTRQSFVVEMVGRQDLHNAIALNSSMFNSARILGPSLAGVLVAAVGEGVCFAVNAASFVAVIGSLLAMRLPPRPAPSARPPFLKTLREGLAYAFAHRPSRSLLILLAWVSLTSVSHSVLMPIFADRILGSGPRGLGLLMGATGAGCLAGALRLATRKAHQDLVLWIYRAALGLGASLILFALSRLFWLSAALLLPVGFCLVLLMASANTRLQLTVPDELRGRIMSLFSIMYMGMAPLGALMAGGLAHFLGAPSTVALCGGVCLAAAWAYGRTRRG